MAAARPEFRSKIPFRSGDGDVTADENLAAVDAAFEEDVASYEVGAGVPGNEARRPFLRAVLDGDAPAAAPPRGEQDGDREVFVHDRFARLDAGLPPLKASADGWGDEALSPTPAAGRAEASRVIAAATVVRHATWQHLAPPVPEPIAAPKPSRAPQPNAGPESLKLAVPNDIEEPDDTPVPDPAVGQPTAPARPELPLFAPMVAPETSDRPDRDHAPARSKAERSEPQPAAPRRRGIFRAFSG